MSLSVGIVGLPNAGKSTLFNALVQRRLAETAPRPFTTINPHEAVVSLPDEKLSKLSELVKPEKTVPASVTFIDIAGLVKGAHQGEGLGNQFLGHIREVNAIAHVVRVFEDANIPHVHGLVDPKEDIAVVNLELELGGIKKPTLFVLNLGENQLGRVDELVGQVKSAVGEAPIVAIPTKLEEEAIDLSLAEKKEILAAYGETEMGIERLIRKAYELLDLITFYTIKGGKEVHAWSIKRGASAIEAAGEVHSDFAKNFIKAEVINVDELLESGGWKDAKEKGKIRLEGRDYVVCDKDVIEFKVSA
ncbi:MAG: redox-regulated ATPase YchF [Patescibacteria group bacterium]